MLMLLTIPLVSATVTNIIASEDTFSYFQTPDANMGGNTEVSVWNYYGRQSDFAYIKFSGISGTDSPNIPANSNINSATMWLYTRAGESQTITFYTPSASWTESGLTWNNQPSPVTPYASVAQDGSTAHWTSIDVTNIVRKWNDGTITNNGLVALSDGGGASASTDWRSKENITNKPYISVDYTAPSIQQIDKSQLKTPSPATSPSPPEPPQSSNSYLYAGIVFIVFIFITIIIMKNKTSPKEEKTFKTAPIVKPETNIRNPEIVVHNDSIDSPNILVSITSSKGFKVGIWEKLDVNILNVGEGMARDIEIKLSGPLETSGNKMVQVLEGHGGQTDIVIGVKPKEPGNIPLKVEVVFFDQKSKRYRMTEEAFISVAKESETISMRQTPIINIGSIGTYVGEQVDKSTKINGSQILRSNVGAGSQKCPECGREVESNEKFCLECGAKL